MVDLRLRLTGDQHAALVEMAKRDGIAVADVALDLLSVAWHAAADEVPQLLTVPRRDLLALNHAVAVGDSADVGGHVKTQLHGFLAEGMKAWRASRPHQNTKGTPIATGADDEDGDGQSSAALHFHEAPAAA